MLHVKLNLVLSFFPRYQRIDCQGTDFNKQVHCDNEGPGIVRGGALMAPNRPPRSDGPA